MEGMLYMYMDGPRIGALRRRFPVGQESVFRREQREKQRTERAMYFLFGFHMSVYRLYHGVWKSITCYYIRRRRKSSSHIHSTLPLSTPTSYSSSTYILILNQPTTPSNSIHS